MLRLPPLTGSIRRALASAACAAALAGAAAGCGKTDQQQAQEVVQQYVDARAAGDFDRVCELFSDGFKDELGVGENCAAVVGKQTPSAGGSTDFHVIDVRVRDERAVADIDVLRDSDGASRIALVLELVDGDWRIIGLQ